MPIILENKHKYQKIHFEVFHLSIFDLEK